MTDCSVKTTNMIRYYIIVNFRMIFLIRTSFTFLRLSVEQEFQVELLGMLVASSVSKSFLLTLRSRLRSSQLFYSSCSLFICIISKSFLLRSPQQLQPTCSLFICLNSKSFLLRSVSISPFVQSLLRLFHCRRRTSVEVFVRWKQLLIRRSIHHTCYNSYTCHTY